MTSEKKKAEEMIMKNNIDPLEALRAVFGNNVIVMDDGEDDEQ